MSLYRCPRTEELCSAAENETMVVTKCAAEEAIADLRRAIATYYQAKKRNARLRFPSKRRRSRRIGGFGIANDKFRVAGHEAALPRIGRVNMAEPLRFEGRIVSGRVTEHGGRWYLTVVVDVVAEAPALPPASVGIDFGLSRFATLSNGEVVETQARLRKGAAKLKRLQRGLSRKQKGSKKRAMTIRAELALGERMWTCEACGAKHDRDENAAINLHLEGLALPAGSGYVGVTPVELGTSGRLCISGVSAGR